MRLKRTATLALPVAACACLLVASAQAAYYPYKPVAADQRAAQNATLTLADVGDRWANTTGFNTRPESEDCKGINQVDGLVITGYAGRFFKSIRGGAKLVSTAEVFQTAKMNELNWKRTATQPTYPDCVATGLRHGFAVAHTPATLRTFNRLALPKVGTHTFASRGFVDLGFEHYELLDYVLFTEGRMQAQFFNVVPVALHGQATAGAVMKLRTRVSPASFIPE